MAQNFGTKPRTVTGVLRTETGADAADGSLSLSPGRAEIVTGGSNLGFVYCVFDGLSRSVRGSLVLTEGDKTLLVVPAAK